MINGDTALHVTALSDGPLSFSPTLCLFLTLLLIILFFLTVSFPLPPTCHPFVLILLFLTPLFASSVLAHFVSISISLCVFVSLSAAMLWRCSDLQPSLDRVRSASTTCLRPDINFYSPDSYRYKKGINTHELKLYMNQVSLICTRFWYFILKLNNQ